MFHLINYYLIIHELKLIIFSIFYLSGIEFGFNYLFSLLTFIHLCVGNMVINFEDITVK